MKTLSNVATNADITAQVTEVLATLGKDKKFGLQDIATEVTQEQIVSVYDSYLDNDLKILDIVNGVILCDNYINLVGDRFLNKPVPECLHNKTRYDVACRVKYLMSIDFAVAVVYMKQHINNGLANGLLLSIRAEEDLTKTDISRWETIFRMVMPVDYQKEIFDCLNKTEGGDYVECNCRF